MATYYGVASVAGGTRANTSLTIPASSAEGAIALINLYIESDTPPTPPSGFSEILAINHTSNVQQQRIYWKRLLASEGSTAAAFVHASTWTAAVMIVWDDASETVNPWTGTGNQGTDSTAEALGVTPLGDNAGINYFVGDWDGWVSAAAPAGSTPTFTERYDANTNVYAATGVLATAAATGDKSTTNSDGADQWTAALAVVEDVAEVSADDYPIVMDIRNTIFSSNATSHNVAMPSVVLPGELLLVIITTDGDATIATPTDWTQLYTDVNSTVVRGSGYIKVADGTEDGSTVDFVTSAAEQGAATVYRITNWGGTISDIEATVTNINNGGSLNPVSETPSWGSAANMYIVSVGISSTAYITAYSTGYSDFVSVNPAGGTASAAVYSVRKTEVSSSEDPSTWTASGAAAAVIGTIAIRPTYTPPAGGSQPYDKRLGGIPFARSGYYPSMARW